MNSAAFKFKGASDSIDGVKTYTAIASTDALDRDREILIPKGCEIDNFVKNPVMLYIHDYRHVPVGKVSSIRIDEKAIEFDFVFIDTDLGKQLEYMYNKGYMSAFSVGLYPIKSLFIDENTPKQFTVEVAKGGSQQIDLSKYAETPRKLIHLWELLEISPVPVPSNPEALIQRAKEEVVRKYFASDHSKAQGQLLEGQLSVKFLELETSIKTFLKNLEEITVSNVIKYASTDIKDLDWDISKCLAALSQWASSDKSGDKSTMDWNKYSEGFSFVDSAKADMYTSYKLPHHTVNEAGELIGVWKGITSAMSQILANKEQFGEDAKEIYAHLASHYSDFSKTAPEFDKEYTEEDLKNIEDDVVPSNEEEKSSDEGTTIEGHLEETNSAEFKEHFESLKGNLHEMEETIRLRMNILVRMLEELHKDVKNVSDSLKTISAKELESATIPTDEESETSTEERSVVLRFTELTDLLQGLNS